MDTQDTLLTFFKVKTRILFCIHRETTSHFIGCDAYSVLCKEKIVNKTQNGSIEDQYTGGQY